MLENFQSVVASVQNCQNLFRFGKRRKHFNCARATSPNLDGKTVLVLAVKGDKATNPTVQYSFVDMAKVVKAISVSDNSINVNGYAINVNIFAITGNLLELKNDGLFVSSDDTRADKVANATAGNIATLDANGNLVDSGISFAVEADITAMLNSVFGSLTSKSLSAARISL